MKSKEALKYIEENLKSGQTKKEIYDTLIGKIKFKSDLLQLLAMVPDQQLRVKYDKLNFFLFVLLVVVAAFKIFIVYQTLIDISRYLLPFLVFAISITSVLAFMVWNFRGYMYRFIGMLGIANIVRNLSKNSDQLSFSNSFGWVMEFLVEYMPTILIIFIAYYIGFKVFPYYGFWGMLDEKRLKI